MQIPSHFDKIYTIRVTFLSKGKEYMFFALCSAAPPYMFIFEKKTKIVALLFKYT